ncbi:MAG: hypothetical protein Q7J32_04785 [Sphingomonadaceae bacterium]|nr:hypothetical protein [Sphingomonadaceae bacterium]
MKKFAIAVAILAMGAPALADTASLFRDGKYAEAAQAGAREGTPEAQVTAARSLLAIAAFRTADKTRAIAICNDAVRLAEAALAQKPGYGPAILQKGIAVGYVAKLERSQGKGKEARRLMDQARTAMPGDAFAWAALGGWHGEAVATLGGFLAGAALGAKKAEAIKAFDTALTKDGAGAVVPTYYAFTLLSLDADNAPRARTLLAQASRTTPRDAFDVLLKRQAEQVLPLLVKNDVAGARALAKRLQPFGTIV